MILTLSESWMSVPASDVTGFQTGKNDLSLLGVPNRMETDFVGNQMRREFKHDSRDLV